jgi:hypothetical protein
MPMLAGGASVWEGDAMAHDPGWIWQLPNHGVAAIEQAMDRALKRGRVVRGKALAVDPAARTVSYAPIAAGGAVARRQRCRERAEVRAH